MIKYVVIKLLDNISRKDVVLICNSLAKVDKENNPLIFCFDSFTELQEFIKKIRGGKL